VIEQQLPAQRQPEGDCTGHWRACPRFGTGGASPSPVVGAWRVQSIEQVLKDGTRRGDWMGPRPAGLVIFDPSGAFSLQYGRGSAKRT
jgi:hypothetical protein